MSTIIDKTFSENVALLEYLTSRCEVSLSQLAEDSFRKVLVLAAASYFEQRITDALHNYSVRRTSADACIVSMIRIKVLSRQYHTFFDWDKRNAGTFFRLLGDDIGNGLKKECTSEPLKEALLAFLELGYIRNCLVHQNFAGYVFEKTTKEVYELYCKAVVFADKVIERLEKKGIGKELEERIRERAYSLYLARGEQSGTPEDDWARAEAEVLGSGG